MTNQSGDFPLLPVIFTAWLTGCSSAASERLPTYPTQGLLSKWV
jgi:hypothetical protein